jgi:hypothetical protein
MLRPVWGMTTMPRRARSAGQPTRGKTALNRLRQIDTYVALALPGILAGGSPLVIDVGFGAYTWTTLEMREHWLRFNPRLRVLGVEIDPEWVTAARPYADPPAIDFRVGGFNLSDILDVPGGERARLIRCYNVLRQYDESAVRSALGMMAAALEPGGILIEGTSNPTGRIVAFDVYGQSGEALAHRALVFGTNFRGPVEPVDFQTILPRRLIHHMLDPRPSAFFEAWRKADTLIRGIAGYGAANSRKTRRVQWIAAATLLKSRFDYPVDTRAGLFRRGYVTLRDPLSCLGVNSIHDGC